jgi:hypothetical protein
MHCGCMHMVSQLMLQKQYCDLHQAKGPSPTTYNNALSASVHVVPTGASQHVAAR